MTIREIDEVVSEIAADLAASRIGILAGAGLSMLPPSSLPSGRELLVRTLDSLATPGPLRAASDTLAKSPALGTVVPEVIFQRLYESLRDSLWPAFDCLRGGVPNIGHASVASLSRSGIPVATTNFDLLVEDCRAKRANLAHLHGALDQPAEMATRINQVGRGLSRELKQFTRRAFGNRTVVVLGYSGNDKDVVDALVQARPASVHWIVRNANDWAIPNIGRLPDSIHVEIYAGDLTKFFELLIRRHSLDLGPATRPAARSPARGGDWATSIDLAKRYAALYKVANELGEHDLALTILDSAPDDGEPPHTPGWFLTESAESHRQTGNYVRARSKADDSIAKRESPSALAGAHNVRGLIDLEKPYPRPAEAVEDFRRALAYLLDFEVGPESAQWSNEVQVFRGRILNNLGLALEASDRDKESVDTYLWSVACKRKAGDLPGIAQTAVNLTLCHYRRRRYARAQYWKRNAAVLIDKYELVTLRAELWEGLSRTAEEIGLKAQARSYRARVPAA